MTLSFLYRAFCRVLQLIRLVVRSDTDLAIEVVMLLDRVLILGHRHLETVLAEYVEHYNSHRLHRSLNQSSPFALDTTSAHIGDVDLARLRRTDRLGGVIHEYRMVA